MEVFKAGKPEISKLYCSSDGLLMDRLQKDLPLEKVSPLLRAIMDCTNIAFGFKEVLVRGGTWVHLNELCSRETGLEGIYITEETAGGVPKTTLYDITPDGKVSTRIIPRSVRNKSGCLDLLQLTAGLTFNPDRPKRMPEGGQATVSVEDVLGRQQTVLTFIGFEPLETADLCRLTAARNPKVLAQYDY